ncbi:MAG: hypothetical protein PHO55_11590 [Thiomonas arsenitoxydans]|jgi:hypothetical protein|nr:hypothetical protein [Thiomonas arsenitoxydans]
MFGSNNVQTVSFHITDPGADDKNIHLMRAPSESKVTIKRAYLTVQGAQGAGSATEFYLYNFGTAGTAIKSSGGTVAAKLGGTATTVRLSAATPAAYTISNDTLAAGEWLVCNTQETGDWVEVQATISLDYVIGDAS